jgi:uncharacterized membrane protein YhaH (DUF805 family)
MHNQSLLFGLKGRINRAPWWVGNIGLVFISILILLFAMATTPYLLVLLLGTVYAGFALSLKRARDRDRPEWYVIGLYALSVLSSIARAVIPPSGLSFDQMTAPQMLMLILDVILSIWGLVLLIDLGFLRGTQGPNRYGPDPLAA